MLYPSQGEGRKSDACEDRSHFVVFDDGKRQRKDRRAASLMPCDHLDLVKPGMMVSQCVPAKRESTDPVTDTIFQCELPSGRNYPFDERLGVQ
jgi:hypothetical protein